MRSPRSTRPLYRSLQLVLAALLLAGAALAGSAALPARGDQPGGQLPDTNLAVPWEGVLWQSLPNLTWADCGLSTNTRKAVDLALGQWSYAASNQGVPVHFSELPCDASGNSQAQILVIELSENDLPANALPPDLDVFGLTMVQDANGDICEVDIVGPCVAQGALMVLFSDAWQNAGLTYAQAAKTVAHEFGHAVGLGHAKFCTYDSIMAQNCEPLLQGLGSEDVQSLDALVDYARQYFGQPPIGAIPPAPAARAGGTAVTYHAGYNLVAGPAGTSFAAATGALYTYLPGDNSYDAMPASQPAYNGYGYWAYFPKDVTVQLNGSGGSFYTALADPGTWFLLGNDNGTTPMRVLGAASVQTYDNQSGQYQTTNVLQPGQAAWVEAGRLGEVAVFSTALSQDAVRCLLNLGNPNTCQGT